MALDTERPILSTSLVRGGRGYPRVDWTKAEDALLLEEWSKWLGPTGQARHGFLVHITARLSRRSKHAVRYRKNCLVRKGIVPKQWKRAEYVPITLSPVDAAWLAGILDGEGHISFSVCRGRRTTALGLCANTDEELLARVQRLVPSASVYRNGGTGPDNRGIRSNRQCYTVVLQNALAIQDVLSQLIPHISHSKKRAKAFEMLSFVEGRIKKNA